MGDLTGGVSGGPLLPAVQGVRYRCLWCDGWLYWVRHTGRWAHRSGGRDHEAVPGRWDGDGYERGLGSGQQPTVETDQGGGPEQGPGPGVEVPGA